ncbi:MAG: Tail-specific protease [Chlamydiales bacterium]|nr:Tail-specific protease [Chlamydiales bacterium]MCH9619340.1 Tail-specific protease [Chlamydiales bacterium]MCH9622144.1 Tail-specific protease [Chlamydiales bacterium]
MRKWFLLLFILLPCALFGLKLPSVTPSDVNLTLRQIMENHAAHKELSPTLVKRAIESFIDDLDPTKVYFLASDLELWLQPSQEELSKILEAISSDDFSTFSHIHSKMVEAVKRRNLLEEQLKDQPLPKEVSVNDFKEMSWAESEEELSDRILKLKALQKSATEAFNLESREKALRRIEKRRQNREDGIVAVKGQNRLVLSNVLKAFAASFDTHTAYFTPAEAAQFMIQVQQRLFGIGAQLRDDLNGFTIVKIIEGGPASRNTGLKPNDRVIAIDNEPVIGFEITDAVELIRGEEGTVVNLTVLRPDGGEEKRLEIPITRGEVVIQEARIEASTVPFGDGVIAYIALHAFYQDPTHSSGADLYEEIENIRKDHRIKGIILDLRDNSGGVLPQAVTVTGLFITKGIVVSIKDNQGNIEHLREIDGKMAYDGPLVVLTSKASASAAEIVSQTLQDYGRAIVVGDEYTYGKGTFQTFTLDAANGGKVNSKGEFKVTRGRYYTVSGKSPQLVGVKPDIVVPGFFSALDIGEQHSKYPLENDSIDPNFQDDLSDIPLIQRDQISWLYRFNLQPRLKIYTRFLPILKENSKKRLENDKLYQAFLEDINQEEVETKRLELYSRDDPQLKETFNVMKDLILLLS